jgi:hypothetical protein
MVDVEGPGSPGGGDDDNDDIMGGKGQKQTAVLDRSRRKTNELLWHWVEHWRLCQVNHSVYRPNCALSYCGDKASRGDPRWTGRQVEPKGPVLAKPIGKCRFSTVSSLKSTPRTTPEDPSSPSVPQHQSDQAVLTETIQDLTASWNCRSTNLHQSRVQTGSTAQRLEALAASRSELEQRLRRVAAALR